MHSIEITYVIQMFRVDLICSSSNGYGYFVCYFFVWWLAGIVPFAFFFITMMYDELMYV